jgi:zinc protease
MPTYTDTIWGILTGFDAGNALRIAQHAKPLTIRNVVSGTEFAMDMVQQGTWYSELEAGLIVEKKNGEEPVRKKGPTDSTNALVEHLNKNRTDLFITSGHATERDWMIGYSYKNGFFKCRPGQLFGIDTSGETTDINSPNPKVYMPVGNCLMGHIDSRDAMALAWMNSGGVMQMIGYTVPTWYGYAGWGCLDYFVEQPSRYTFAEAVFANHQALVHRLTTYFPTSLENEKAGAPPAPSEEGVAAGLSASDARGRLFDRDVLAFYGDPAWEARMAPAPLPFEQELSRNGDVFTFTIKPNQGTDSFRTIDNNGSQRGGRPFFALLPERIGPAKIVEGGNLNPVITENFILVPRPGNAQAKERYVIRFQAGEFQTP